MDGHRVFAAQWVLLPHGPVNLLRGIDLAVGVTPKEFDILRLLMSHPGKVYSPQEIYRAVWKEDPLCSENTVAVHVRHLREKIEIDPRNPRTLKLVWGQGYKMEETR